MPIIGTESKLLNYIEEKREVLNKIQNRALVSSAVLSIGTTAIKVGAEIFFSNSFIGSSFCRAMKPMQYTFSAMTVLLAFSKYLLAKDADSDSPQWEETHKRLRTLSNSFKNESTSPKMQANLNKQKLLFDGAELKFSKTHFKEFNQDIGSFVEGCNQLLRQTEKEGHQLLPSDEKNITDQVVSLMEKQSTISGSRLQKD